MDLKARLIRINDGCRLERDDECYYYGEYLAKAGWKGGPVNAFISNLKADLSTQPQRAAYKQRAIVQAAELLLNGAINKEYLRTAITLVPAPPSKPRTDPRYDDRMLRVLTTVQQRLGEGVDIRQPVYTKTARESQHYSSRERRLLPDELLATLALDQAELASPMRQYVFVIDDVFTLGTTFVAMKRLLSGLSGVEQVVGISMARTTWPTVDAASMFDEVE